MTTNGKPHFVNSVQLTVRIGTAPEKLTSATGKLWARARIALPMGKMKDGSGYRPSLWLTAKAFTQDGDESLVDTLADMPKGTLVTLSGRLAYDEYETQAGERRSELSVVVNAIARFENDHSAASEFDPPGDPF
jgi:single-stranded DNA-binding protein